MVIRLENFMQIPGDGFFAPILIVMEMLKMALGLR
jgi:hypothetical protein